MRLRNGHGSVGAVVHARQSAVGSANAEGGLKRKKPLRARPRAAAQLVLACEPLELRRLLTGTWTTVTNAIPGGGAQNAMVLSDGTIMVHGGNDSASNAWYKLTPNDGNYVSGTWSTLASNSTDRLFFPSEVLPNGNVVIIGGEYSGPSTSDTFINTGDEYNPVSNSWSTITTFPQSQFGDDPTEMLPNGDILCGYIGNAATYLYNPSTNAWSQTGTKLRGDRSDEEAWVKLPDDSILSYDVFASISSGTPSAQRYIPSSGTWVDAGTPPAQLSAANVGYEMGPGFLLPNGSVFYGGGTNATAYYNPSSNTWSAGPTFPSNTCMSDAPGAVLPNGDLLLAVSPRGGLSGGNYNFPSPTYVYELNTTTGVYTNVTPSLSGFSLNQNSFASTFVVLPSGQVMMFNDSGKIAVFTENSGSPSSSWAPSISNITNTTGSNTFTLTGYQLNGISEGASYGDDNEMSSNYPIIQLTDQNGNITYARTFNWTLDGVASTSSSVSFTEPVIGDYIINVIANGIASAPVLDIPCSSSNGESFAIQPYTPNTSYLEVNNGENGSTEAYFYLPNFTELIMTGDAANNTLVINDNLGGKPTIINGGNGSNTLDVENNGTGTVTEYGGNGTDYYDFSVYNYNLSNVANFTYVEGGTGNEQVFLYDEDYTTGTTYTVTAAEVTRSGFGGMFYGIPVNGISLIGGTGSDTVDVDSTYTGTPVTLYGEADGSVYIGQSGSVQSIAASVTVINGPAYTYLTIDDSSDSTARGDIVISNTSTGSITGLAPVPIYWTPNDISGITINGGTGGNDFYVSSADIAPYTTTINAGTGSNQVNFENVIAGAFSVNGQGNTSVYIYDDDENSNESWSVTSASTGRSGFSVAYSSIVQFVLDTGYGNDTVDIESDPCPTTIGNYGGLDAYSVTTGSQSLANIGYTLTVNGGAGGYGTLTLDNASYAYINFSTITSTYVSGVGAPIYYSGISTLTYDSNTYSNVIYLTSTYLTTSYVINGGSGGNDELDVGEGSLSNIQDFYPFVGGGVTYNPGGGSSSNTLLLDDSSSGVGRTLTLNSGSITNGGALSISYTNPGTLSSIVVDGSNGNNVFNIYGVLGSTTQTSVLGGSGNDTFNVGPSGGNLSALGTGDVTVNGGGGTNTLAINGLVDANFDAYNSFEPYIEQESPLRFIVYYNLNSIALNIGAGGSGYSFNVYGSVAGTPITVNNGSGTDTINVYQDNAAGPIIVAPTGGNDPVNVATSASYTGGALVEFVASQQIGALTIGTGGTALVPTGPRVLLQASSVATSGTGTLDLTTNDLVVHSSTLATVSALVKSGFNNGTWTGAGITSSSAAGDANHLTALGTILNTYDGTHPIFSSSNLFDGYAPSITDILVKHTYYGDANLDGKDDGSDYSLTDNGYLHHLAGWYNGDFNYDGTVNGTDYTLIDNTYNRQGASLAAEIATAKAAAQTARLPATQGDTAQKKKLLKTHMPLLDL